MLLIGSAQIIGMLLLFSNLSSDSASNWVMSGAWVDTLPSRWFWLPRRRLHFASICWCVWVLCSLI